MYNKSELQCLFGNGMISRAELEILSGSESLAKDIESRVEKQASSTDKDLISKCASSDVAIASSAAHEYSDRVQQEGVNARRAEAREIEEITKEFESIARKQVRKAGQTKAQQEAEIWAEHSDLLDRYASAQRLLLTQNTR